MAPCSSQDLLPEGFSETPPALSCGDPPLLYPCGSRVEDVKIPPKGGLGANCMRLLFLRVVLVPVSALSFCLSPGLSWRVDFHQLVGQEARLRGHGRVQTLHARLVSVGGQQP